MREKGSMFHKTAQQVLIGLNVFTRYNNRVYRIDEILLIRIHIPLLISREN